MQRKTMKACFLQRFSIPWKIKKRTIWFPDNTKNFPKKKKIIFKHKNQTCPNFLLHIALTILTLSWYSLRKFAYWPTARKGLNGRSIKAPGTNWPLSSWHFCLWIIDKHSSNHPQLSIQRFQPAPIHSRCPLELAVLNSSSGRMGKQWRP